MNQNNLRFGLSSIERINQRIEQLEQFFRERPHRTNREQAIRTDIRELEMDRHLLERA